MALLSPPDSRGVLFSRIDIELASSLSAALWDVYCLAIACASWLIAKLPSRCHGLACPVVDVKPGAIILACPSCIAMLPIPYSPPGEVSHVRVRRPLAVSEVCVHAHTHRRRMETCTVRPVRIRLGQRTRGVGNVSMTSSSGSREVLVRSSRLIPRSLFSQFRGFQREPSHFNPSANSIPSSMQHGGS